MPSFPLIAVDVGNSRTKLGHFPADATAAADRTLPAPSSTLDLSGAEWSTEVLGEWSNSIDGGGEPARWVVASVNRAAAARLDAAVAEICPGARPERLTASDLPLAVRVASPQGVGIDRLLGAVAANRVRTAGRAAVVLHVGTAITANLVAADGSFRGGAILPGIGLSARALHDYTDLLPRIDMLELAEPPDVVGNATEPAIRSGLFWGAVGAMRELVSRIAQEAGGEADVLLTGGAAPSVAHLLGRGVRYEPHLVLAGIALSATR